MKEAAWAVDLRKAIMNRRSIRSFSQAPVSRKDLLDIFDAALWAPSANNRQPWEFYVVQDETLKTLLHEAVCSKIEVLEGSSELAAEILKGYRSNFLVFKAAPVMVVSCYKKPNSFSSQLFQRDSENQHMSGELMSLSMALQNIMLLAFEKGIGSLIMTAPLIAAKEIGSILKIPNRYAIGAILCLGYPEGEPAKQGRKQVEKVVHFL